MNNLQAALEIADDGESVKAITEALSGMGMEVSDACYSGIGYIQKQERELEAVDAEIKRLKAYKDWKKKRLERVKRGYTEFLLATGNETVETGRGIMSVPKGRESVVIDDITKIPSEFMRQKITVEPDKVAIKTAISKGRAFEGAHIERNRTVIIK